LRASGGQSWLTLQLFAEGYFGDNVPIALMADMVELQLDFGIEQYGSNRDDT
jgi:hypothetical protein